MLNSAFLLAILFVVLLRILLWRKSWVQSNFYRRTIFVVVVDSNQFVQREVGGTYYYYYKGIICPSRCVQVFNSFALNVEVEYITHNSTTNATRYVASNYVAWGLSDTEDKAWFDAMKKLYEEPTATERENATIITLN